jgi:putative sensory transduction regulator
MTENTTRTRPARTFAQQLRKLLAEEGYRPRLEQEDGEPAKLHFKVEGNGFQLRCREDDPDFVQVCTGYVLEGATKDELSLLRAANDLQAKLKVVKVWIPASAEFVEFQVELFLGGHPLTPELLERCISMLRHSAGEFWGRVKAEAPRAMA